MASHDKIIDTMVAKKPDNSNGKNTQASVEIAPGIDKLVAKLVNQSQQQIAALYQERMFQLLTDENSPLIKELNTIAEGILEYQIDSLVNSKLTGFLPENKS